jgi:hypothetical protein
MVLLWLLLLPLTLNPYAAAAVAHQALTELLTQVHPPRASGKKHFTVTSTAPAVAVMSLPLHLLQACRKLPNSC